MVLDLKRFEVLVEPRDYYKSGDTVNCILVIDLIGVLKCKHVLLTALGEVSAKFNRAHMPGLLYRNMSDKTNIMQYPFDLCYLVRSEVLKTGIHRIPFSFVLQNSLLPTHKVDNGEIRYYIQAVIDKKLFTDFYHLTTAEIIVKTNSNIPLPNNYEVPLAINCEKTIRALGLKVGFVRLSAHFDRSFYFSGEHIRISFHLDNRSQKFIRMMPQMVQKTTFKDGYITLDSQQTISSSYSDVCQRNMSLSGVIYLKIPQNTISTFDSPLVAVKYEIEFFVDISGCFESFQKSSIFIA